MRQLVFISFIICLGWTFPNFHHKSHSPKRTFNDSVKGNWEATKIEEYKNGKLFQMRISKKDSNPEFLFIDSLGNFSTAEFHLFKGNLFWVNNNEGTIYPNYEDSPNSFQMDGRNIGDNMDGYRCLYKITALDDSVFVYQNKISDSIYYLCYFHKINSTTSQNEEHPFSLAGDWKVTEVKSAFAYPDSILKKYATGMIYSFDEWSYTTQYCTSATYYHTGYKGSAEKETLTGLTEVEGYYGLSFINGFILFESNEKCYGTSTSTPKPQRKLVWQRSGNWIAPIIINDSNDIFLQPREIIGMGDLYLHLKRIQN